MTPEAYRPRRRAARIAAATLGLALLAAASDAATAAEKSHPVSEFFVGVHHHDAGVFGRNKEDGPGANIEWRFDAFDQWRPWRWVLSPRPTLGANVNTAGDTSALYLALTWSFELPGRFFFDWSMGGTVHDGELSTTSQQRKELGTRALFYLAAGLGYRFGRHHGLSLRLDHMSNASLGGDNSGLDTVGLRYSYRF